MIRGILFFLFLWLAVGVSINAWRQLTGKEMWSLVKTVVYGAITASIAFVFLVGVVILF